MTDHFDKKKLGEIVAIRGGKRLPKGAFLQLEPNSHPYIRVRDMGYRKINRENLEFVPDHVFPSIKSYTVEKDDVLISIVGTVGLISIVDEYFHRSSQTENCAKLTGLTPIDAKYLYYFLSSQEGQSQIRTNTVGAVQPKLPLYGIANIDVTWPRESIRMLVARYLEHLDDKIELNRQLNQTLESMAQALFKSWFVDFDPVIDNAIAAGNPIPEAFQARAERRRLRLHEPVPEGQSPLQPLPAELRQLFPNSFHETEELGWVPEGWEVSEIGKEVENVGGGTPSTANPDFWSDGEFCFCTPKDMSMLDSLVLNATERHLTKIGVSKISSGLLPIGTVLMSSRAPIGYVAVADRPVAVNQGIIALKPNRFFGTFFLVCWIRENLPRIMDRANGSTFPEISKTNFRPLPFLVSDKPVLTQFKLQSELLLNRISQINLETKLLKEIRDSLLPKLLSGQLRIPDAEAQLAEAGL